MDQYEVTIAGFGGQGILTAGQLLAYTGMYEDKQVIWLPSYGPEMRGGTAYCTVVISDARIGSPIISNPTSAIVMNRPSFDKFAPKIKSGGLLIINSSLIDVTSDRKDITQIEVPANDMAMKAGNAKAANIAILGAFIGATDVVGMDNVRTLLQQKLGHKKDLFEINLMVLQEGYDLAKKKLAEKETA
jgi:2-oxoglutarate ferredoxin oxidoreductase subunit gamma